ncbi:hypothetical protein E2C01_027168 [Portunus trituberculatus]|uniref:Uncharacterized protein n=1 Tax=Portunus trituberculatus TaxID=210409 RepID=A0A5B7EN15_PORTR|nr:hypothetical protein [Portunus trituberculatus]
MSLPNNTAGNVEITLLTVYSSLSVPRFANVSYTPTFHCHLTIPQAMPDPIILNHPFDVTVLANHEVVTQAPSRHT